MTLIIATSSPNWDYKIYTDWSMIRWEYDKWQTEYFYKRKAMEIWNFKIWCSWDMLQMTDLFNSLEIVKNDKKLLWDLTYKRLVFYIRGIVKDYWDKYNLEILITHSQWINYIDTYWLDFELNNYLQCNWTKIWVIWYEQDFVKWFIRAWIWDIKMFIEKIFFEVRQKSNSIDNSVFCI